MDGLLANYVILNCSDRSIVFSSTSPSKLVKSMCLYLNSIRIIGSQRYILFLASIPKSEQRLSEIPIVKGYPDVFLEDIQEFPLKRDIEFSIDLIPGMGPISVASY